MFQDGELVGSHVRPTEPFDTPNTLLDEMLKHLDTQLDLPYNLP